VTEPFSEQRERECLQNCCDVFFASLRGVGMIGPYFVVLILLVWLQNLCDGCAVLFGCALLFGCAVLFSLVRRT